MLSAKDYAEPPHEILATSPFDPPVSYQYMGPMVYPSSFTSGKQLRYGPNPTTDYLHIYLPVLRESARMYVYDTDGTLRTSYSLPKGDKRHRCDVSNLARGVYYAYVVSQGEEYTLRFVKR